MRYNIRPRSACRDAGCTKLISERLGNASAVVSLSGARSSLAKPFTAVSAMVWLIDRNGKLCNVHTLVNSQVNIVRQHFTYCKGVVINVRSAVG